MTDEQRMAPHYEHALGIAANKLIRAAMAIQAITQEHDCDGAIVVHNNYIAIHISRHELCELCDGDSIRVIAG